ncbi:MAG TPA: ABC transporter, partial [Flavobacteriaceae bacterium]|nr:ABC transporter [Flavobacteriaceae bacterium]
KIVDHLFVFKGEGEIQDFPGNYSDYRTYEDSKPKNEPKPETVDTTKTDWKKDTTKAKLSYHEQKEHRNLEKEIAKLEKEKEALQNKFATENWDGEEIDKQSLKLQEIIDT